VVGRDKRVGNREKGYEETGRGGRDGDGREERGETGTEREGREGGKEGEERIW